MAHGDNQVDELITSTLQHIENSGIVQDTVFSGDPLLSLLESKGKKKVQGGTEIRVNLRIGKNPNVGSYAGRDPLNSDEFDSLGHAIFQWKQYSGGFSVAEIDMLKNRGNREKLVDLWTEKVENTTLSLKDDMIEDLYGDGLGNSGKDILGLDAILDDTGVLGGIDRARLPAWQAQIRDFSGETDKSCTLRRVKRMIRNVRGPGGRPDKQGKVDIILVNADMYEHIDALVDDKTRMDTTAGPVAELGFPTIKISGAEVVWTDYVPDGEIWYLSTEYMGIRVLEGRDFTFEGPIKAHVNNEDARKAFLLWAGNMVVENCRYLGRDVGYVI